MAEIPDDRARLHDAHIAACAALPALLALARPWRYSLWKDELFSVFWSAQDLRTLWTYGFDRETNPPLYYSILHAIEAVAGTGQAVLETWSAVVMAGTVALVYRIARTFASPAGALWGAVTVATSPAIVWHALEVRMYAQALFLIALATLGVARIVARTAHDPPAAMRAPDAFLCVAETVGAAYTHVTAGLFAMLVLLLVPLSRWHARKTVETPYIAIMLIIVAATMPIAAFALRGAHSPNLGWIAAPTVASVTDSIVSLFVGPSIAIVWPQCGLVCSVLLVVSIAVAMTKRRPATFVQWMLAVGGVYLVTVIAVSFVRPVLLPRTLLWLAIPLGIAVAGLRPGKWTSLCRAAMIVCACAGQTGYLAFGGNLREPWLEMAQAVGPHLDGTRYIVIGPNTSAFGLIYYMSGTREKLRRWAPDTTPAQNLDVNFADDTLGISRISSETLRGLLESAEGTAIVMDSGEYTYFQEKAADWRLRDGIVFDQFPMLSARVFEQTHR